VYRRIVRLEKLANLCSLKKTTRGKDLFVSIDKSLNNFGLELKKLVTVTSKNKWSGKHEWFKHGYSRKY